MSIPDAEKGASRADKAAYTDPNTSHDSTLLHSPTPESGDDGIEDFTVKWENGDQDPLCPRNIHPARKWAIVLIVSSASFCITCASSIYTSTYHQMESEFHSTRTASLLGLSVFVFGIGLGPLFLSPMSEFFGRRPIYLVSWPLYIILIIPQGVGHNIESVVVTRFVDGFAGSAFLTVAGGTVGDLFGKDELQAPMALYALTPFVGPCAGPLIGGFINYYSSWRWTVWFSLILAGAVFVGVVFLVPETYHPVLLRRKAQQLRQRTGDERWTAAGEKPQHSLVRALAYSLLRPFQLLILEPMCLNLCIYSALLLGILYLFFGAFPLVYTTVYHFNQWQVGLTFIGLVVGLLTALSMDPVWHRIRAKLVRELEEETGIAGGSEPEFRLVPSILGGVLVPLGIFVFAWTSYPSIHWIVPLIGSTIFASGLFLVFSSIFTFLVDAYPVYAASAMAANAFLRASLGGAFPLFGDSMYKKMGHHWATTLLALLTFMMMPFPYIFFKYGKKIRAKSRFAKH